MISRGPEAAEDWNDIIHDESEEIPDGNDGSDANTQNPFGFLFSSSVTQCFAKEPVEVDKITFFSDNTYDGEIRDGIIHGHGTYIWTKSGTRYTGTFDWGSFTGVGKVEWKDGSWYEGSIKNGVRDGKGVYTCVTEDPFVYDGEWKNGMFNGFGICHYGSQDSNYWYEGQFKDCLREGKGTMHYPSGNVYEGDWHMDKRHGQGKFTWHENGSYYVGEFVDGELNGRGEMVYGFASQTPSAQFVQANRYVGEFANSKRSGQGTFYYANGSVYKGEWQSGMKTGEGVFTSRDGRVYRKDFLNGSIYEDGKYVVPTPSISLSFPLDGLLSPSESKDEVMESLCNIYVRSLPGMRSMYQRYSKIQWTKDKTVTGLRIIGVWRMLQDKGTVVKPDLRLSDIDDIIKWKLESPTSSLYSEKPGIDTAISMLAEQTRSTYGFTGTTELVFRQTAFKNDPLRSSPDPYSSLCMYQLFEAFVRLAKVMMPSESLVLQVMKFLDEYILCDATPAQNEWARFREMISTSEFDEIVTEKSQQLLEMYIENAGFASGSSIFQARQLDSSILIDPNVDARVENYQGLMTIRDLVELLSARGIFYDPERLKVMDVLLFLRYGSVAREIDENEVSEFKKFFTLFMKSRVTFVEFVQCLGFVADKVITSEWTSETKFKYLIDNIEEVGFLEY